MGCPVSAFFIAEFPLYWLIRVKYNVKIGKILARMLRACYICIVIN